MRLVMLTGGAGAPLAHALAGLVDDLTVVAPTTRDGWVTGLKRSPDLDALMAPADRPTFGVADALGAIGFGAAWHRADDAEMARRLVRTELLHAGFSLTEATEAMAARLGLPFRLVPLSDDRGELHVVVEGPDGQRAVHLDEHAAGGGAVDAPVFVRESWAVSETVTAAVTESDAIVVGPPDPALGTLPLDHALTALETAGRPVVTSDGASADDVLRRVREAVR